MFGKQKTVEEKMTNDNYDAVETVLDLKLYIPEALVKADLELAKLSVAFVTESGNGSYPVLGSAAKITDFFWFQQFKTASNDRKNSVAMTGTVKLDKFLAKVSIGGLDKPLYLMCDMFYDQKLGYVLKALGVYSSIPRVLSVNFKHHGELKAEKRNISFSISLNVVPDSLKLEKRCRPLFAWLELGELLGQ